MELNEEQLKRAFLFKPCTSQKDLHNWIKVYLNLDIPDCTVDPTSNSNPMDLIWEVYDSAIKNDRLDFSRILAYASRDSYKSMSASILEVLSILHLKRSVAHMAAIENQAAKVGGYIRDFLNKPIIREYIIGDNKRRIEFVRYWNKVTDLNLNFKEWSLLSEQERGDYEEIKNYMSIVICSISGANSEHTSYFCVGGDSLILVKPHNGTYDDKKRDRVARTARGIFNSIAGFSIGGNPKLIETADMEVSVPKKLVEMLTLNLQTGNLEFKPVLRGHRKKAQAISVKFDDGKDLVCTPDHPLYVWGRGFIEASWIVLGDKILSVNRLHSNVIRKNKVLNDIVKNVDVEHGQDKQLICGSPLSRPDNQRVFHISRVIAKENVGERWVYDFTVQDNHNFFANGLLNKNCVDEVDVIENPKAYEEAKMIPAPINGLMPITLLTSTRKYSFGLVQKEIDEASKSGLHVRHWNIIDTSQACPPGRHRPDLPKLPIYRSDVTLKAFSEEEFAILNPKEQELYVKDTGYSGCLTNCKIFASCQSRLASKQTSTSSLLKPIEHVQSLFRAVSVETARAQLLCWKPSMEGLVYPRFERDTHLITASEMAHKMTGEDYPDSFGKADLLNLLKQREVRFYAGMDFGFTHMFAVVIGAVDGNRMFVFDVYSVAELELPQKIELCQPLKELNALIFPDTAYPADIKSFRRAGFKVRDWDKGKGSVVGGIEIVRSKLMPGVGEPQLYFLRNDPGCELLAKHMSSYHWKMDAAGRLTDQPDDKDDDILDATRYLVMNVFSPRGKVIAAQENFQSSPSSIVSNPYTEHGWMRQVIGEHTGEEPETPETDDKKGKRGGFVWSF